MRIDPQVGNIRLVRDLEKDLSSLDTKRKDLGLSQMKEKELREHATCSICKKKIGHTNLPLFWTVVVERHGINLSAIRRGDALGVYLGSSTLAEVMGTSEEMTETLLGPIKLTVCEVCAGENFSLYSLLGRLESEL